MQIIFATLVLLLAGFAFLVFLVVPRLRRHALKAIAAVFGFAAGSVGSMFFFALAWGLSGVKAETLPVWGAVAGAILANVTFYGGGLVGAWAAVKITGWGQTRLWAAAGRPRPPQGAA